ncbi:MAG: hypothetical protein D6713_00855 [Deltaproteobacteria bacterium]|nr:MAG: hypothetical protein D6713_00855 [Deltaproteobacteria bacterium]
MMVDDVVLAVISASEKIVSLATLLASVTCYDREDFIHTAYAEVVEAIRAGGTLDDALALAEKKLRKMLSENGNGRKRHLSFDDHEYLVPGTPSVEEERLLEGPDPFSENIREVLRERVRSLPLLERRVLTYRFGLFGSSPRTIEETARALGISPMRVKRAQRRALRSLREQLYPYFPLD